MNTGRKFKTVATVLLLCLGARCIGTTQAQTTQAQTPQAHRKTTKKPKPHLPALPSGPTGPVQQVPLDSMAPVPPQVSYQNSQLTIVAPNSTLSDILRAVRKQTGADIEVPVAPERVVTHLGPGSAREVIAQLLNGSRFNYVLLGSPADSASLTRVVLVAKIGQDNASANNPNNPQIAEQSGVGPHTGNPGAPLPEADANAVDTPEDAPEDAADQAAAEAEQPAPSPDQPAVKTPQQMLQEMQQRQMQLQQQQQPGQPPVPNQGIPPQQPPQQQ